VLHEQSYKVFTISEHMFYDIKTG